MKALSFSHRNPLSNGNAAHSVIPGTFGSFHHEMDRWLDDTFNGFGFKRARSLSPCRRWKYKTSIANTASRWIFPASSLKDIELTFSEGLLTLKGERPAADGKALYSSRREWPL